MSVYYQPLPLNNDGNISLHISFQTNGVTTASIVKSAASENDLTINTVNGDITLSTTAAGTDITLNAVDTIRVQSNKLGFFDKTGIIKQTAANATGFAQVAADGASTRVQSTSTFTGGVGNTAYTVGDVIAILKNYGLLTE